VRYPAHAKQALADASIKYGGWLPGIPTIRPFEALACGIPLLSAPWQDAEHLFTPGKDFRFVQNGAEMKDLMQQVISTAAWVRDIKAHGLKTIQEKHTCAPACRSCMLSVKN